MNTDPPKPELLPDDQYYWASVPGNTAAPHYFIRNKSQGWMIVNKYPTEYLDPKAWGHELERTPTVTQSDEGLAIVSLHQQIARDADAMRDLKQENYKLRKALSELHFLAPQPATQAAEPGEAERIAELGKAAREYRHREFFADSGDGFKAKLFYDDMLMVLERKFPPSPQKSGGER